MRLKLVNGLLFNASWLLIVLGQSAWLAWLVAAAHVSLHLWIMGRGRSEFQFIVACTAFGLVLDQLLFASGLLLQPGGGPAPLWLSALWPVLATTSLHAFSSLARFWWLAALLGAVGGYGSYRLGASLTEVSFGLSPLTDSVLAALWAGLFPAMLWTARRMDTVPVGRTERALPL